MDSVSFTHCWEGVHRYHIVSRLFWLWWLFCSFYIHPWFPWRRRRKCFWWDCCFSANNENTFTTSTFCFCSGNNILPQTRLPLLLLAGRNKRRNTAVMSPTKLFLENRFISLPSRTLHDFGFSCRSTSDNKLCRTYVGPPWTGQIRCDICH